MKNILLKLSRFLENMSFKLRQKSIYYELKHYIKKKESYLKDTFCFQRNIGKSYSLVKLACKYNLPIATTYNKEYLKNMAKEHFNKDIEVFSLQDHFYSKRFDIILVDEVDESDIKILEKLHEVSKIVIGYRYNS